MDAYIGEIRAFSFGFVPEYWLRCDGTLYPVMQYQALASLLGNRFGGNGVSQFGVPNLQVRIPFGSGVSDYGAQCVFSANAGQSMQWLNASQFPLHTHTADFAPMNPVPVSVTVAVADTNTGQVHNPSGNYLSQSNGNVETYAAPGSTPAVSIAGPALMATGGAGTVTLAPAGAASPAPVDILPSHVAMYYYICYYGEYPIKP